MVAPPKPGGKNKSKRKKTTTTTSQNKGTRTSVREKKQNQFLVNSSESEDNAEHKHHLRNLPYRALKPRRVILVLADPLRDRL